MSNTTKLSKQIIFSCFLAGCLEIYDFTIFGFLSGVIHKNYLGFMDTQNALVITYALFAVGFVFRPLGAIIFGYIGDKYGRKTSLVISISMMGSSSLAMFLLPSYTTIGISACYIIVLIRIIQGLSVGGEYSGAIIYAVEHFKKNKTGLIGSVIVSGCLSGVLLATLVSNILKYEMLPDYSWRFAFLLGFGLSIIGFFIRIKLQETPEFLSLCNLKKCKLPLLQGLKKYKLEALASIFIAATNGINLYYVVVYIPGHLKKITNIDFLYLPIITTIVTMIVSPVFGFISDKINRAFVVTSGIGMIMLFSFIMMPLITKYETITGIITIIICHALIHSIQAGTMNSFVIEIFPTQYRFSCSAFCYSIGMGVIGGTSPMIAQIISNNFENYNLVLSVYVGGIALLGFIMMCLVIVKRKLTKFENLDQFLQTSDKLYVSSNTAET